MCMLGRFVCVCWVGLFVCMLGRFVCLYVG